MADYVIVGAGSAGCVLAERLSARHSVILLEAGEDSDILDVRVPAAFSKLFKTQRDWDYSTAPEEGAGGRSLYLPRGKMIGGSSSLNAMLYVRGRPSDYGSWQAVGGEVWGWDQVRQVFIAMESNTRGRSEHHGSTGPLRVTDQRSPNPVTRAFLDAAIETGIPANPDFNGPTQDGVGLFQVTQRRGRRWSAADAFLRPASGRPTLRVVTDAQATRILFDAGRAVGVEYRSGTGSGTARAEREVILSAGAYGSPHLLQLSGVGPAGLLTDLGVPVVHDLPAVGSNLQDHPVVPIMYDSLRSGTLDDAENTVEKLRWLLFRRGRLTSPVAEAGAFVRSDPDLTEPDLEFHFAPASFESHGLEPYPGHAFTLGPVLVNPKSRGRVSLRSADPSQPPLIEVNCLADPADMDALVAGVDIARDIVSRKPLDAFRGEERLPGPQITARRDVAAYVRDHVELLYHPAGTCRMGSDEAAVVDDQLRVKGVEGLRVVDASVMPTVTSGNTNAPVMMIAEMAARMILGDQRSKGSAG